MQFEGKDGQMHPVPSFDIKVDINGWMSNMKRWGNLKQRKENEKAVAEALLQETVKTSKTEA